MQERFSAIIAQNQQNQNDNSSDVETLAPCFYDRLFTGRDVRTVLVRRHLLNIVDECSGKLGTSPVSESLTGRISISEAEPLINCWATVTSLLFKVARVVCLANAWLQGVESRMRENRCLDMAQPKDVVDCGHQSDHWAVVRVRGKIACASKIWG